MKKLLLSFCCLPLLATAQNFHFSARLGLAGYSGDLKKTGAFLSQMKPLYSFGAQYDLSEHLAARTYFSYTRLKGSDARGTDGMKQRNLSFETKLLEWELTGQYSVFSLNNRWWTPYLFAGIGIYRFNPYTQDASGTTVYLQPLSTEGQGFSRGLTPYRLTQFNIPLGIGAHYSLGEDTRIGIETGYRKLFTDYLDDVSTEYVDAYALQSARGPQAVDLAWRGDEVSGGTYPTAGTSRGTSAKKDGYYYVAVTFTMRYWFDKYKQMNSLPGSRRDKKVGCPASRGF